MASIPQRTAITPKPGCSTRAPPHGAVRRSASAAPPGSRSQAAAPSAPLPFLRLEAHGHAVHAVALACGLGPVREEDRKSTRLNSSHANISYAVFCLKKKKKYTTT